MNNHNIEQVDYLRNKAGITYEEAIELLDRFGGDLPQCLVELERSGRINNGKRDGGRANFNPFADASERLQEEERSNPHRRPAFVLDWEGVKAFFFSRVLVRKGDLVVSNFTVLFLTFVGCAAPWVLLIGLILTFLNGYRINWQKAPRHTDVNLHAFVEHAAENVRATADSVAEAVKRPQEPEQQDEEEKQAE